MQMLQSKNNNNQTQQIFFINYYTT